MAPNVERYPQLYPKDKVIIQEGEEDDGRFFYLQKGKALAELRGEVVGEIREGEFFGEMSAILGSPRNATVRPITDCDVIVFAGVGDDAIYRLIVSRPQVGKKLIETLVRRIVETSQRHAREQEEWKEDRERWRKAISGTLYALQSLCTKYKSKVMEEVYEHLRSGSGVPHGDRGDTDLRYFRAGAPALEIPPDAP